MKLPESVLSQLRRGLFGVGAFALVGTAAAQVTREPPPGGQDAPAEAPRPATVRPVQHARVLPDGGVPEVRAPRPKSGAYCPPCGRG